MDHEHVRSRKDTPTDDNSVHGPAGTCEFRIWVCQQLCGLIVICSSDKSVTCADGASKIRYAQRGQSRCVLIDLAGRSMVAERSMLRFEAAGWTAQ